MEYEREGNSSLKQKFKSSLCFSCCFRNNGQEPLESDERPTLIRASSTWLRSKAQEFPEIKEKYRSLISRMSRSRRHSADFRYDPLSYALNFDEGFDDSDVDEFPLRNFSARLPSSPPRIAAAKDLTQSVVVSREIAAFS